MLPALRRGGRQPRLAQEEGGLRRNLTMGERPGSGGRPGRRAAPSAVEARQLPMAYMVADNGLTLSRRSAASLATRTPLRQRGRRRLERFNARLEVTDRRFDCLLTRGSNADDEARPAVQRVLLIQMCPDVPVAVIAGSTVPRYRDLHLGYSPSWPTVVWFRLLLDGYGLARPIANKIDANPFVLVVSSLPAQDHDIQPIRHVTRQRHRSRRGSTPAIRH